MSAIPTFQNIPEQVELLIIDYPRCPKCNKVIKVQEIKFCPYCGTNLKEKGTNLIKGEIIEAPTDDDEPEPKTPE